MKATAIDEVLTSLVATLDTALSYPVFDGPPNPKPGRSVTKWLSVGAEDVEDQTEPTNSATMEAEIIGLGQVARSEDLNIECVAVGKADSVANARGLAFAVISDVGTNLPLHPTPETYGAHVSGVSAVRSHNKTGGAVVHVQFTITVKARLT